MSYLPDNYVTVNERVMQFRQTYPNGFITTEAVTTQYGTDIGVRFTARIYRSVEEATLGVPAATGHSELILDNEKVLEKAETVAIGRAIAFLGFAIQDNVASAEEIENYKARTAPKSAPVSRTETRTENVAVNTPADGARSRLAELQAVKAKADNTNEAPVANTGTGGGLPKSFKRK